MGAALGELLVYPTYTLSKKEVDPNDVIWHSFPPGSPGGGVRRPFLWLPAPQDQDSSGGALIYFHANAETLADVVFDMRIACKELGMSVLAVEYPGYGLASPDPARTMTEGIDLAAIHALRYIVTVRKVPPPQVILQGRSLGSGPALRLALYAREDLLWTVGAVVLHAAYTSLAQLAQDCAGAAGQLLPNCYDNLATLGEMCGSQPTSIAREGFWIPLLLIHGELDKMVPSRHSRALLREARKHGHPSAHLHIQPTGSHNEYRMHEDVVVPLAAFKRQYVSCPKKGLSWGSSLARYPMPKIVLEGVEDSKVARCCGASQMRVMCEQQCAQEPEPARPA